MAWHDLRRSFATWSAQRVPFPILKTLLGHEPDNVTLVYVRPTFDSLLEAVDSMPWIMAAAGKTMEERAQA